MKTKSDFENLRQSVINASTKAVDKKSLDLVTLNDHFLINNRHYRVVSRYTITESNKKFTKTKDYVSIGFTLFCLNDCKIYFLDYGVDDYLEIYLSPEKIYPSDIGIPMKEVDHRDEIRYDGVRYFHEEDWYGVYSKDGEDDKYFCKIREYAAKGKGLTFEMFSDTPDLADSKYEACYFSEEIKASEIRIC